jgi:putative ubiquitin-RnfH superfamily antitoxin RatB of RatAB toxin-antitoxin module
MAETVNIQLVYALPDRRELLSLVLPAGTNLQQALEASGLPGKYGVDVATGKFGIFGKQAKLDTILRDRDRVEIYRPLIADPKEMRKARVAEKKARTASKTRR